MYLRTPRLTLYAATLAHVRAELEHPARLRDLLDAEVSVTWPPGEYDRGALEFFRDRLEEGGASVEGWYGWYAVRDADAEGPRALVGAGGYLGPPDPDGMVEIGYSVLPEWQRRGYASEMVEALVTRAFAQTGVRRVIAHTTSSNTGSVAVLLRCGFQQVGAGAEPGSIRFECAAPSGDRAAPGRVEVRKSAIEGLGLFAGDAIAAGARIRRINVLREVTSQAPLRPELVERADHCDYPDGRVVLLGDPDRHVNHSCDPNAWVLYEGDACHLVARREIGAGEEITCDYSINIAGGTAWPCHCGAARCRGTVVGDFFALPADLQREYRPLLADWFVRRHAERVAALDQQSFN